MYIYRVATPAMIWSEWLSNGPTIVFLTITLTDKKEMNRTDLFIIISFFVCIVCGFLPIIPQPRFLAYVWIVMASVACLSAGAVVPALVLVSPGTRTRTSSG